MHGGIDRRVHHLLPPTYCEYTSASTSGRSRIPTATGSRVVNAMSIDVEDYFQVTAFDRVVSRDRWGSMESRVYRNTERLLAIFEEANVVATFFVLGWIAERFPGLVRRIACQGHELASHGFDHRLVYDTTPDQFREDIRRAKGVLEDAGSRGITGYRAPSFSITGRSLWALDVLIEEGFSYDASIYPLRHDRYGVPDAPRHVHLVKRAAGTIWEMPASTVRCAGANLPVGGGGYFRLLPYGWTQWGINRVNAVEQEPAIFYLHPWELDANQPRLPSSFVTRLRHYGNLAATEGRLRRLLGDFAFGPFCEVLDRIVVQRSASAFAPSVTLGAIAHPLG